jgi:DNA-binding NarL/FixJ family response regulator
MPLCAAARRGRGLIRDAQYVTTTIRVVLGEDSLLAREGIVRVLSRLPHVELLAVCESLEELLTAVDSTMPDLVLTDIRMPPTNTDEGMRLATELRSRHPTIGVLVLSQYAEPVYARTLFAHGAEGRGYLLKERLRNRDELDRAIRAVASGGSFVDPAVVDTLLSAQSADDLGKLTPREDEILALVADGLSNAGIARALGITKRAVERHINSIFVKLNLGDAEDVSRRVKAALLYLERPRA